MNEKVQERIDQIAALSYAIGKIAEGNIISGKTEMYFWELYWLMVDKIEEARMMVD